MACKQVHTIRCDGHTISLVETRSHAFYINLTYAGTRVGNRVQVSPKLHDAMRRVIEAHAEKCGWKIS